MPALLRLCSFFTVLALSAQSGVAHSGTPIIIGSSFAGPNSVALDAKGDVYVADTGNNAIREIVAINGAIPPNPTILTLGGGFNAPMGVAVDGNGNVFVADTNDNAVKEILAVNGVIPASPSIVTLGGGFKSPLSIAVDTYDNVFVADFYNSAIKEIGASNGAVRTIFAFQDGLEFPVGVALDAQGDAIVTQQGDGPVTELVAVNGVIPDNPTVRNLWGAFRAGGGPAVDRDGNIFFGQYGAVTELLAVNGAVPSIPAVLELDSGFAGGAGVAIDGAGNVFVADPGRNAIEEIPPGPPPPAANGTVITLGSGFQGPSGVAVDDGGNVFVADIFDIAIKEIVAVNGAIPTAPTIRNIAVFNASPGIVADVAVDHSENVFFADLTGAMEVLASNGTIPSNATVRTLAHLPDPAGIAVDGSGNVFIANADIDFVGANTIEEILATNGVIPANPTILTLGSGYKGPCSVVVDSSGNVFVADSENNAVKEILAVSGAVPANPTIISLGSGFNTPSGVAVDANGDVFVADTGNNAIKEIVAVNGAVPTNPTILTLGYGFKTPIGIAVDRAGNVFVGDFGNAEVKEILVSPPPSPLAAAVLPGSRSVEAGTPATIFATMLNTSNTALEGCGVTLPLSAPPELSLGYQATDPTTNELIGYSVPNQPVAIPANGFQTFLLTFEGSEQIVSGLAPVFGCDNIVTAPVTPGVNTMDLTFSATPIADVIALALTTTNDGTLHIVKNVGAFALATVDLGALEELTLSTDTGSATLPLTATVCQTTPTGQCLAPPARSLPVSFAATLTPTFSVFISATESIPFAPGASRLFVRLKDNAGNSHGSTSVAVTTN